MAQMGTLRGWTIGAVLSTALMAVVNLPASAQDQTMQEFNEPGVADTPKAGDAVRMTAKSQIIRRQQAGQPDSFFLFVDMHTENSAVADDATGCLRVSLLNGSSAVSSYITCTPRQPGRGGQPATVRDTHAEYQLPTALTFDGLGFLFYNDDHRGQEMLNVENVGKVVSIASQVVSTIRAAQGIR